jgi:uncharacterized membrane protein YtjA (UPF0391 family)
MASVGAVLQRLAAGAATARAAAIEESPHRGQPMPRRRKRPMLATAAVFFVVALVAALFGFGGIAAGAAGIAKVLFFVFVAIALAAFVFGLSRRP